LNEKPHGFLEFDDETNELLQRDVYGIIKQRTRTSARLFAKLQAEHDYSKRPLFKKFALASESFNDQYITKNNLHIKFDGQTLETRCEDFRMRFLVSDEDWANIQNKLIEFESRENVFVAQNLLMFMYDESIKMFDLIEYWKGWREIEGGLAGFLGAQYRSEYLPCFGEYPNLPVHRGYREGFATPRACDDLNEDFLEKIRFLD
jgi:hypothetical protein